MPILYRPICRLALSRPLFAGLALAGLSATAVPAAEWVGYGDLMNYEVVALWEHPLDTTFSYAGALGTWTTAERYGVEIRIADETEAVVSPWGGVHIAWDDREGTIGPNGRIKDQALVLGLIGGGQFHLVPDGKRSYADLTLTPFGRAGVGFQHGYFTDMPTNSYGEVTGEVQPIRYEFALGAEATAIIARRVVVGAGVGLTWFYANQSTTVVVNNNGSTVAIAATYAGNEPWARLTAGVRF